MQSISENISNFPGLDANTKLSLLKKVQTKSVKKRTVLQKKGDFVTKTYFVKKGLLRAYTIDAKGKEHIYMFGPEGWIVSDIQSYTLNTPSALFIDALEDSEIEIFEQDLIDILRSYQTTNISIDFFSTQINQLMKRIGVLQKRVILLMSATAQERYEDFLETYPQIVQRVPQKMIASYLGITPESLSKIRRYIAKGQ